MTRIEGRPINRAPMRVIADIYFAGDERAAWAKWQRPLRHGIRESLGRVFESYVWPRIFEPSCLCRCGRPVFFAFSVMLCDECLGARTEPKP